MIQLKINTIDRTALLDWNSVEWESNLTSEVDLLNFSIKIYGTKTYKPSLNDEVEFFVEGVKVFGGTVIEVATRIRGRLVYADVQCKDFTHLMDGNLVVKIYENTLLSDVINDIKTNFLPAGFTTAGVNVGTLTVKYVSFNYEQPSKCLQQLADLFGLDWYVDPFKDIHMFVNEALVAPFNLTDTNGKYFFNSLVIRENVRNLRNTIFVRGGEFKGTTFTEKETADGVAKVFKQGFRYSTIVVKKGGVTQTLGIDNINDPTLFDVLYNFNEKAVKFRDDNKPANGVEVEVTGLPHIPVLIKVKDNISIGTFGEFQHKVVDKSINSKEGARDRAKGEILAWAEEMNDGSFRTKEHGLRVGQAINIQSTIRGLDKTFIIKGVRGIMKTPTDMNYEAILLASESMGAIDFFQKLLMNKDKEIEIKTDEVLDKIESAFEDILLTEAFVVLTDHNRQLETINFGESVLVQALNYSVEFVYAPFAPPTGFKREGNYDSAVYQ